MVPPPAIRTVAPAKSLSGWYLRGDLGYRSTWINNVTAVGFAAPTDSKFDGTYWVGLGGRLQWNQVRADLTADYGAATNYTGTSAVGSATARVQTVTGLANFYYDVGTWWGVTPYVGAGAGMAYVRMSDFHSTTPPMSVDESFGRYNFAWALMAGASYQFMPNLSVDLGYRFLNQGNATTAASPSGSLTLIKLQSHELRVGVRWMYDSASAYR